MSITLTSGQVLNHVHYKQDCIGSFCALHKPSDHYYKNYPLYFNENVGIWERLIGHNEAVPDPDNLAFQSGAKTIIYENKAECIECGWEVVSTHRHHYLPCGCGKFVVDGGHDYLRRIGGPFIERSVLKPNPVYA